MIYTDLWPLIQQDILGCLASDETIGTRTGVAVEPGDAADALDRKVQLAIGAGKDGKVGIGFWVLPIERAMDENPGLPGGPFKLTITVQFVENVVLNRGPRGTQLPVRAYVARAARILKLYTPVGLTSNLVPVSPVITEFTPDKDASLRVGQCEFMATEADFVPFLRISRPQIVVTGSAYPFTVTIVAPGANTIYYTTDGSHPYDGNPAAVLYAGPVVITAAGLFRVRSFAPPQIGSDTAAYNFI